MRPPTVRKRVDTLKRVLARNPRDHFALTRLGSIVYEERRYREALTLSRKAFAIAPHCPLVLWDLAGSLDALGKRQHAIAIWRGLLRRGVQRIAMGRCGEGEIWARSLLTDCRFRLGEAYGETGRADLARRHLQRYLAERKIGARSIYTMREARDLLFALQ